MPRHTNLVRRGAIYYYRARVPSDLRQHYQRSEFWVSLKTSDRHHAECVLVDLRHQLVGDFQRLRGKERQRFDKLMIQPAVIEQTGCDERTVWDLVDYWSRQAERRPRTQMEVNTTFERLVACNGNLAPGEIQKQHIVKLKDWLLEKGLAAATVRKAINLLSAVFELAVANDLLPFNPARGIRLAKPKVERKSRVPFDASDLKRLFASPVFSQGARPLGGRGEAAYWLPCLGLWTGARLEELGQLLVQDVQQEQGNHYLAIQDDPVTDTSPLFLKTTRTGQTTPEYFYAQNDHLGTPQQLIDQAGEMVWAQRAEAFGKTTAVIETVINNLRFPGQYYDRETNTHYNYFRDYEPGTGRYVQKDPVGLLGGVNKYGYVYGNPLILKDVFGLVGENEKNIYGQFGVGAGVHLLILGVNVNCGVLMRMERGAVVNPGQFCRFCTVCARFGPGLFTGGGISAGGGVVQGDANNLGGASVGAGGALVGERVSGEVLEWA